MYSAMADKQKPHVPANVKLPETTLRAFVLGAILSVILAGANAYLGLFAGMTVSASIPAAVLSMAILRFFKNSNILENNISADCRQRRRVTCCRSHFYLSRTGINGLLDGV